MEQMFELADRFFAFRQDAKNHQAAFVRKRLEKTGGARRVLDHLVEFADTAAAFEVMQFHTYTNKSVRARTEYRRSTINVQLISRGQMRSRLVPSAPNFLINTPSRPQK